MISAAHLLRPYQPELLGGAWCIHVPLPEELGNHWLNANDRDHWTRRSRLTEYWRKTAKNAAKDAGVPVTPIVKAWVYSVYSFRGARRIRRDVGNFYPTAKACMDGFTDAKMWDDDCDGKIVGPDPRRDDSLPKGLTFIICPVVSDE